MTYRKQLISQPDLAILTQIDTNRCECDERARLIYDKPDQVRERDLYYIYFISPLCSSHAVYNRTMHRAQSQTDSIKKTSEHAKETTTATIKMKKHTF